MAVLNRTKPADLYRASATEPAIVDVPAQVFTMVDGKGNPNASQDFQDAIGALYSAAYGLKFALKKQGVEYHVPPLEGLWWAPDMRVFNLERKGAYHWTVMIALPEGVTVKAFEEVRAKARERKPSQALERMRLAEFREGLAAQIMHVGPYATEAPTIAKLHAFIRDHGYKFDGTRQKHHEIYLGDPRRAAPEKLKTVIRQPISPA